MSKQSRSTPNELIPKDGFVIEFPGVSEGQASKLAVDLERELQTALRSEKAQADIKLLTDPETQAIGEIIAIILGAKATVAIALGLWKWMNRKNQAKVTIRLSNGTSVEIRNSDSEDVERQIKALKLPELGR